MSYGSYVNVALTFNVIAKVKTKRHFSAIACYESRIECVKHEMYDQYEYGSLDVSEYDYADEDVKDPLYADEFYIVRPNGTTYMPENDEIVEVIEVLQIELCGEEGLGEAEEE